MLPNNAAVSDTSEAQAAVPAPSNAPGPDEISIDTRFGRMAFLRGHTVEMPRGMMGFAEHKEFGLAQLPDAGLPSVMLLQSLTDSELSFLVVPLDLQLNLIDPADIDAAREELSIMVEHLAVLMVVSVRDIGDEAQVSVNLRAPIFVDIDKQNAWQYVMPNGRYPIRHVIASAGRAAAAPE